MMLRRDHLPIALVLGLSLFLDAVGLTWGLPNYVDWAVDTVAPFNVLEGAFRRFSGGWYAVYPPFHMVLLALLYAPVMAWLLLTGALSAPRPTFPFGLEDPLGTLSALILISRAVSVLMGVGIVLLVYLVVRDLFERRAALIAALIVALNHPLVYYAHNANVDVPYLFWSLLAIRSYVRVLGRGRPRDYVLFALFATIAICTKDQAYGLFLLSPIPVLWARLRDETLAEAPAVRRLAAVLADRRNGLALLTAVVTFVLGQNLVLNASGFVNHVRFITGPGSELYEGFPADAAGRLGLLGATVSYMAHGLTIPVFVACVAGSVYCTVRFPRTTLPLLFLAVSYYVTFVNAILNVAPRFVLPLTILSAFFGAKLLSDLWDARPWQVLTRPAICLALAWAALFAVQVDVLFLRDSRYAAERWMREHVRPGELVETFAPHSLHKYYPRFPPHVRVRSGKLAAGTRWEPRETPPHMIRAPNLDTGREAPDYIVLSEFWYRRFLEPGSEATPEARVLRALARGETGYDLAAEFKTPVLVPLRDLKVNPRILVFRKVQPASAGR